MLNDNTLPGGEGAPKGRVRNAGRKLQVPTRVET